MDDNDNNEKQQPFALLGLYGAEWRGDQTQAERERRARGLLNAAMAARPVLQSSEAELLSMLWPYRRRPRRRRWK